VASTITLVD